MSASASRRGPFHSLHLGLGPSSPDLLSYAVVVLTLLLVGAAASWLPAWRATRLDPMAALRLE